MFRNKVADESEVEKQRTIRFFRDEKQGQAVPLYHVSKSGKLSACRVGGKNPDKPKGLPKGHEPWQIKILDPGSDTVVIWNRVFLLSCLVGLLVDPLIFYLPKIEQDNGSRCIGMDHGLSVALTCVRSLVDLFYMLHIVVKFHTAYVNPSSRVFGGGELIMDPTMIRRRYIRSDFFTDLLAAVPLPQVVIWLALPLIRRSYKYHNATTFLMIILAQYVLRLYLTYILGTRIIKAAGVVTKSAWVGAAYTLLLYLLASHNIGAAWYLFSITRQKTCWRLQCQLENSFGNGTFCNVNYLDCESLRWNDRLIWAKSTNVFTNCDATNTNISFNFGIYGSALTKHALSGNFIDKYIFAFWWGLHQMSSYGRNLMPTTFLGETAFAIFIVVIGLILFAHLIANMQNYLHSIFVRVEEWRLKQRDTEEWMSHRQLPHDLQERVRQFLQYKWIATRGVDEESVIQSLPADLRRDIHRHLFLDLVRRVAFFSEMDDQLLDAICERLLSSLSTEGTFIFREGDPVTEMLFIIRGVLESSTTDGGRAGFFNSTILRPGDFCGEELLTWALLPNSTVHLPSSTRTVKALTKVEAFALRAEDLKFVAQQFRRLHNKKLQHAFRFYSHHWRTWAACFIQAAWHRYKSRKKAVPFSSWSDEQAAEESGRETAMSGKLLKKGSDLPNLPKPDEPDFSADNYQ